MTQATTDLEEKKPPPASSMAIGRRGLQLTNLEEMWRFSVIAVKSGLTPRDVDTVEQAFMAVEAGAELGLPPMKSLQSIAVIRGRPCLWGDTMLGLVMASGLLEEIRETIEGADDKRVAVCYLKRKGFPARETTYSVSRAKQAKLWSKDGVWQTDPERMLQMRARAYGLRDLFADVLGGFYMREEMIDVEPIEAHDAPVDLDDIPSGERQSFGFTKRGPTEPELPPTPAEPEPAKEPEPEPKAKRGRKKKEPEPEAPPPEPQKVSARQLTDVRIKIRDTFAMVPDDQKDEALNRSELRTIHGVGVIDNIDTLNTILAIMQDMVSTEVETD